MTATPTGTLFLLAVDPATLDVLDQARADATPDDQLIESVRLHGILQPPTVTEIGGRYTIVTGHRRVGAAIAAGLTEITVIVRDLADVDPEVVKLEQQIVENERRKALSAVELTQGYKKLELFGKTPADIAAELGEKPERIRAGLKINASEATTKLIADSPAIDFEQAAIIADFDDHPKLQRKLIETASTNPANFARDVESSRVQREVDSRVGKLKAQLTADGIPYVDVQPYGATWWTGKGVSGGPGKTLDRLNIRVEEHTGCPGHAAIIHKASSSYLHEQPTDWILFVCTDWQTNGHTEAGSTRTTEQIEREAQWEKERAEREERKQLIDANSRARRTWIHGHLTAGRLRPTATHFDIMAAAIADQLDTQESSPAHIALELLLGEPVPVRYWHQPNSNVDQLATLIRSGATPSLRILVANALATFEHQPTAPGAVEYFNALAAWGYALTDTDREHVEAAKANAAAEAAADAEAQGDPGVDDEED